MASDQYEEQARGYLERAFGKVRQVVSYDGGPSEGDAEDLAEVIRTAAQEAQVRALDELETGGMGFDDEQEEALARLRARIEKEGPL